MKNIALFLALSASAQVAWVNGTNYTRNDYQWAIHNTGQPDDLYSNGVFVSESPGGSYDLKWFPVDCTGLRVGVIDDIAGYETAFGCSIISGVSNVLQGVAGGSTADALGTYLTSDYWVGYKINQAITNGDHVIDLAWSFPTYGINVYSACLNAAQHGVIICYAPPDNGEDIDVTPDFPNQYKFWNVLPCSALTRTGDLYGPGVAVTGTNVIGAPGRNVVSCVDGTNLVYSSGNSYASAFAAGVVAEMIALHREWTPQQVVAGIRAGLLPGGGGIAGNLVLPAAPIAPPLALTLHSQ